MFVVFYYYLNCFYGFVSRIEKLQQSVKYKVSQVTRFKKETTFS